jgi:outer membrane lipoprotein SlyB
MTRLLPVAAALALAAALANVQAQAPAQTAPPPIPPAAGATAATKSAAPPTDDCAQCGRVVSIRQTTIKEQWTPLGAMAGTPQTQGDAQAVTQFKISKGGVAEGPVIVGAAGGAVNPASPASYQKPRWDVTVKLDNGQTRVVQLAYEPYVQEGDRVRIAGRNVELVE